MTRLAVLIAIFGLPVAAQYPYPGGYPAGPYPPMGGAQIPRPGHHKKRQKKADENQQIIGADGRTLSNDGKKLVVQTQDGRTLTMTVTPDTKFIQSGSDIPASKVVPRTTVHVEAAEDDQAYLTAVKVELLKEAGAESASTGAGQEERPTILDAPVDAPGRPILRRGKPKDPNLYASASPSASANMASTRKPDGNFDFTIDADAPAKRMHTRYDDLIEQSRHWVATFTKGLPNYLCQQDTTRYIEQSRDEGWEAQDVVTATVVYDNGHEEYRNITVGGKKTNKSMMDLGGTTSTGEFASMLYSLFDPARQAEFEFDSSGNVGETQAAIYDFKVMLPRSDWSIIVGGQTLRPAYSGTVWIDKKSAVVRRMQMQADNIPHDFPMDRVESAIDYDIVSLGGREFLLPVHSENLSCERGTTLCSKNTIDFRDYHKFEGNSTITFSK
jgi:hypothetical protein